MKKLTRRNLRPKSIITNDKTKRIIVKEEDRSTKKEKAGMKNQEFPPLKEKKRVERNFRRKLYCAYRYYLQFLL